MNRDETTIPKSSVKKVKVEDTDKTCLVTGQNKAQDADIDKTRMVDGQKTYVQETPEMNQPVSENRLSFGRKVGKVAGGFAGGILLGGIATVGTAMLTSAADVDQDENGTKGPDNQDVITEPQPDAPEWVDESVEISQEVNDDMSFSEAFRAAREEVGAGGAFEWRGNVYSTYTAEEWDGMSAEEKQEYNDHFNWARYQTDVEPEPTPEPEPEPISEPIPEPEPSYDDVEILGLDWDPETGVLVGEVAIGDSDVYLIDLDPGQDDGMFDVAVVDINGDGEITEDEVIDISDQDLSVDEFADLVDDNLAGELYATDDSIDYSNDSDDIWA